MRFALHTLAAFVLCAAVAGPAGAADNERYGETRWSELPLRGALSKTPWVGSWWAYKTDGSGYRVHDPGVSSWSYAEDWDRWSSRELEHLSPAEKYDRLVGRAEDIEYEALVERAKKVAELDDEVSDLMDERRALIRTLNGAIRESDDPAFDWRETEDGERYLEVTDLIEDKEAEPGTVEVTVDTAFEYEVLSHGSAQFGVGGWYGHCNAWAAAAIMEPEPRRATEVDGIPFTSGDVKAYITEAYMELHSEFYGTRNNHHDDAEAREAVDYRDLTPAAFHILFADLVGRRDKGFVIDRYTGSQVWNQPVRAFRSKAEPLYGVVDGEAVPLTREVTYTVYSGGDGDVRQRGEQEVYPVLVTTTFHWMSDGLPHETLTHEGIHDEIDDETFASASRIEDMWDHQVELRTLTYELWLDAPMDDPEARIVGDGAWDHGSASGYAHLHPDFAWVPMANVNNYRDYENEHYDYDHIVETLLPGTLEPEDDPEVEPAAFEAVGPVEIPDADVDSPARLELSVEEDLVVNVLTVDVDIAHTYIGDLEVRLVAPDGRSVVLKDFGTGGSADDVRETYDVKALDGAAAAGTWALEVRDQWERDTGTIEGFTLHIK
ncbi:MAG: proprotein convertase P-domain-containing protein [Myxococcota bacterium]